MAKPSVGEFVRQVRQETAKVTWPTRKETLQSVIMVFVMVAVAAFLFFAVDILLAWLVQLALSIGG
jgi:preprotein translocase subunit SecE